MIEEIVEYKRYWQERAERKAAQRRAMASKARVEAERMAKVLVREFGASRVYLFGSLAQEDRFHERSDVDLAVEGIAPEIFFKAWSAAGADSDVPVELVDLNEVEEPMRKLILKYGELLCDASPD
ncbi:MAG: nucleotidyltransferase domain-containing protein [Chloroflexi bacterium]|nr:nucleotidyltransferase domain-containing protein [Chloroflexota bacterium]